MSTPTSVYRYLDADGVLIYVGITNRGVLRQAEHVVHSKWWRFVRSQDVEHYDDRETALRRERYLIEKHQPPFNVVHNADHQRRLAAYLKHADAQPERCGHCEGCRLDRDGITDAYGHSWGCRWEDDLEPDEDATVCEVCGSSRCVYADGHHDGGIAGWQSGFTQGEEYGRRDALEAISAYLTGMARSGDHRYARTAQQMFTDGLAIAEAIESLPSGDHREIASILRAAFTPVQVQHEQDSEVRS